MAERQVASRSSWSGSITFGLVNVPVQLATATTKKDVSFNMLHRDCGQRIRNKQQCDDGHPVSRDEIVRGYQYVKNEYVVVTDDDIEAVKVKAGAKTLAIQEFVPEDSLDAVYFEKSYYVQPDDTGEKAYALLRESMRAEGVMGIAKMVAREKEHLALVRVEDDMLMVYTLFWPDEVKLPNFVPPVVELQDEELAMARMLVGSLKSDGIELDKYSDTFREQLLAHIEAKVAGTETAEVPEVAKSGVETLMEQLRASIAIVNETKTA